MTKTADSESSEDDSLNVTHSNPQNKQKLDLEILNGALSKLSAGTFSPLSCRWHEASVEDKDTCLDKEEEACKIICNIILPMDGQSLFDSFLDSASKPSITKDLEALMTAYANAPSRRVKHTCT
jgi:hypothetical protein